MIRGMLLAGAALSLTACGGASSGGPAAIPTPPTAPVVVVPPTPPVEEKVVLTEDLTVRQEGIDYYKNGDYIAYVNNWGAESMGIAKSDYSQKVEITKSAFPNKTLITWKYPDSPHGNGATVYGFPGISWGKTTLALSGYNTENAITTLGQIDKFSVKYDVTLTGDLKYMNLAHDLFMYDSTGKIGAEILFSVAASDHILYWGSPNNYFGQQSGAKNYQITMNGANYNMLVSSFSPSAGMQTSDSGKIIIVIPTDGSRVTSGIMDWTAVLKLLLDNKDIDPSWIIKGTELGVEVQAGSGSMLVNDFSVTLKLKDQNTQAIVVQIAAATTTASQINAAAAQQILNAAVSNPNTPTYTFSQGNGNAGVGGNFALNNKLSLGTSSVFQTNGYTMTSNIMYRNKNTYAIVMGGAGKQRVGNIDTSSTFTTMETGTHIPTKLAMFAPYMRMGYARYNTNKTVIGAMAFNSIKASGGVNANIPVTNRLLMGLSSEISNEFSGRSQGINVRGVEYSQSVNLSNGIGMIEAGSRKNRMGTNNYISAGMRVPF